MTRCDYNDLVLRNADGDRLAMNFCFAAVAAGRLGRANSRCLSTSGHWTCQSVNAWKAAVRGEAVAGPLSPGRGLNDRCLVARTGSLDPQLPFAALQSRPTAGPRPDALRIHEAAARGRRDPARSGHLPPSALRHMVCRRQLPAFGITPSQNRMASSIQPSADVPVPAPKPCPTPAYRRYSTRAPARRKAATRRSITSAGAMRSCSPAMTKVGGSVSPCLAISECPV